MDVIAPVFHPRAIVSAEVEGQTAVTMLERVQGEGHRPRHLFLRSPVPLTDDDLAHLAAARPLLARGMSAYAIAGQRGITLKRLSDLLARAGIARDGSEVRR